MASSSAGNRPCAAYVLLGLCQPMSCACLLDKDSARPYPAPPWSVSNSCSSSSCTHLLHALSKQVVLPRLPCDIQPTYAQGLCFRRENLLGGTGAYQETWSTRAYVDVVLKLHFFEPSFSELKDVPQACCQAQNHYSCGWARERLPNQILDAAFAQALQLKVCGESKDT